METIAILIVLTSIVVLMFAMLSLVKPFGLVGIRRRRHVAVVVGASIVGASVAALLGAVPKTYGIEQPKKKIEAREGATARADQPTAKGAPPQGVTEDEFSAVWRAAKTTMEGCDAPVRHAGEIAVFGEVQEAYPAIQQAEKHCYQSMKQMRDIKPPKRAKAEIERAIVEARDVCAATAAIKSEAMKKLGRIAKGDTRPSAIADAKAELTLGERSNVSCLQKFSAAADAAGVVMPRSDKREPAPAS